MQSCARLRHHDLVDTLRTDAHVLPVNDEDVANYLAELYGLNGDTKVTPHPGHTVPYTRVRPQVDIPCEQTEEYHVTPRWLRSRHRLRGNSKPEESTSSNWLRSSPEDFRLVSNLCRADRSSTAVAVRPCLVRQARTRRNCGASRFSADASACDTPSGIRQQRAADRVRRDLATPGDERPIRPIHASQVACTCPSTRHMLRRRGLVEVNRDDHFLGVSSVLDGSSHDCPLWT